MSNASKTQPDDLMDHFKGRSLKSIVIFTVIVHLVVILVTSIPFFLGMFSDPGEGLSEEERTKLAVQEANETLARIAEEHGLQAQQLRSTMAKGRSAPKAPARKENEGEDTTPTESEDTPPAEGEIRGDSPVEQKLQEKLDPPDLPPVNDTEDLFE
ncbi:MAG: hypothetical protein R3242_10045 [Akkermansiaceae bacterium]|nr:hypothetical protein [Akkermansiaceae bacterium]